MKKISTLTISWGCRVNYITRLDKHTAKILQTFYDEYNKDPFSEETIGKDKWLMVAIKTKKLK